MVKVGYIGLVWALVVGASLVGCGSADGGAAAGSNEPLAAAASQALAVAPTITSFSPTKAVQGTLVTINGTGFVSGASVSFNGAAASSVSFVSSKRLTAVVPAGSTTGAIGVTVPAGSAQSGTAFQVLPKLTSVDPLHAFVGDFVNVSGSGFTATSGVKLGSLSATFTLTSDFGISASVPSGFTGGKVTVTTPAGSVVSTTSLVVLPLLSAFSPTEGPVGASVTLNGEGFGRASAVKFGTKPATFSVVSDTELSAVVPAGAASGKITVETPPGNRTSSGTFSVILLPGITSFTPLAGELPLTLTINGKNFVGVSAVSVGSVALPSFTLVSSKQLTAPLPLGTPSGKVSVTNAAGTGVSSATFTAVPCSDVDADGVCDRDDRCPGFDDRVDSDQDGIADGCDACPSATSAGQICGAGLKCDGVGACSVEIPCNDASQGPGVLRGNAVIDATDTAGDVARLAGIWCVTGDLTVTTTPFTDLSALSGLVEIAGNFTLGGAVPNCSYPCPSGNPTLASVHGLEGLRRIGGGLYLEENPGDSGVASLAPLGNLKQLGSLFIEDSLALTDLHGLEGLQSLQWLLVEYADRLTSLRGVQNLTSASSIRLNDAPLLADISALSHLTTLDGFQIYNTGLASLHGLEGLTSAGAFGVSYNPNLTDLSPLSNLQTVTGLSLQGRGITSLAPLSHLTTASAVFLTDLGISSLDGLGGIATTLQQVQIEQNQALTSLVGLGNTAVQGWFKVTQNPLLLDCGNFALLPETVVDIENNDALVALSCLAQSTDVRELTIVQNPALLGLDDLASLTRVTGTITIGNEYQLTSLAGLSHLQSAGGIYVAYTELTDLHGLESVTTLGSLMLNHNLQLTSLAALSALTQVDYGVDLVENWNLSQCEIENLETQLGRPVDYNVDNGPACEP